MSNPKDQNSKGWEENISNIFDLLKFILNRLEFENKRMSCLESQSHASQKSNDRVTEELQKLSEMIRIWSKVSFDRSLAEGIYKDELLFKALEEQGEGIESQREIFLRERREKTAQAYLVFRVWQSSRLYRLRERTI